MTDENKDRRKVQSVDVVFGHTMKMAGSKHVSQVKSDAKFTRRAKGLKLIALLLFLIYALGYGLLEPWLQQLKIWYLINYGG